MSLMVCGGIVGYTEVKISDTRIEAEVKISDTWTEAAFYVYGGIVGYTEMKISETWTEIHFLFHAKYIKQINK